MPYPLNFKGKMVKGPDMLYIAAYRETRTAPVLQIEVMLLHKLLQQVAQNYENCKMKLDQSGSP